MGNNCQNSHLEAINSFQQGVENNLLINQQDAPLSNYATRATSWPELNQATLQVISTQLGKQPISHEDTPHGKLLPLFYIIHKLAYYEGEWKCRIPHGRGKLYFQGGEYFQGVFIEGEGYCKNGLYIFRDGSYYRGEIQGSTFQGRGRFVSKTGLTYQGQWKNNKPEGFGKETFSDGNQYQGDFVDGLKEGSGVFKWNDGKIYRGQFRAGKMHGRGKLTKADNSVFEGLFQENRKKGKGVLITPYGVYEGDFIDGEFGGKGKFTWKDGRIYEGLFKNGLPDGQCRVGLPSGESIHCTWKSEQKIFPGNEKET